MALATARVATARTCRLFICLTGAVLSLFVLVQDQHELGRVTSYLQTSLVHLSNNERQLLNGSKSSENERQLGASVHSNPRNDKTIQLLLGDPEMMQRTIQAIALHPHQEGRLVAYVNVMALNCTDRLPYIESAQAIVGFHTKDSGLVFGQPTMGIWVKDVHTTIEVNIPIEEYHELRKKGNGVKVTVRDLVAGTDHTIPLLVDPSPATFLAGLVWINKSRRYYEGRKGDNKKKNAWKFSRTREQVGTRLGPVPRNDAYTLSHLLPWIQYHREQGVQHVYILDQDNNLTIPNFPLTPPFLTYVRAPYAFMDYFVDMCDRDTQKVTNRVRMAVLQHILDSLVLRMTPSEWMIVSDLDEFMVPAIGEGTLPQLIQHFSNQHCQGLPYLPHYRNPMWEQWQNISCTPTRKPVFELQFYQVKMSPNNTITLSNDKDDYWALTKTIYHTPYVARSRVHFGYPLHDSAVSTKILPHKGFLAHFRNGAPNGEMLKRVPLAAEKLKHLSFDPLRDDYYGDPVQNNNNNNVATARKRVKRTGVVKRKAVVGEGEVGGGVRRKKKRKAVKGRKSWQRETDDESASNKESSPIVKATTQYAAPSVIGTNVGEYVSTNAADRARKLKDKMQNLDMTKLEGSESAVVKFVEEEDEKEEEENQAKLDTEYYGASIKTKQQQTEEEKQAHQAKVDENYRLAYKSKRKQLQQLAAQAQEEEAAIQTDPKSASQTAE